MSIFSWIPKLFHSLKVKIAPIVVGILQFVQGAEDKGFLDGVAALIDKMLGNKVAEDINAQIKKQLPLQIALWLGIETISADATDDQIKAFEQSILNAFISKKAQQTVPGQVARDLGLQIYVIIKKLVTDAKAHETAVTAAQIGQAIEEAFQDYQADLLAAQQAQADETQS